MKRKQLISAMMAIESYTFQEMAMKLEGFKHLFPAGNRAPHLIVIFEDDVAEVNVGYYLKDKSPVLLKMRGERDFLMSEAFLPIPFGFYEAKYELLKLILNKGVNTLGHNLYARVGMLMYDCVKKIYVGNSGGSQQTIKRK